MTDTRLPAASRMRVRYAQLRGASAEYAERAELEFLAFTASEAVTEAEYRLERARNIRDRADSLAMRAYTVAVAGHRRGDD